MRRVLSLSFLFGIVFLNPVQSKEPCKFSDEVCVTKIGAYAFNQFKHGWKDIIAPLDSIYVEKINGTLIDVDYELSDAYLKGLADCEVATMKYDESWVTFDYRLHCPQLVFSYYERLKGKFYGQDVDEEGPCVVTTDDYLIKFSGQIEKFVSEKDQKLRFKVKQYTIETELKGNLVFDNSNLVKGDKVISNSLRTYINKNWKALEKYWKSPILESFLKIFIQALDLYGKNVPLEQILLDGQD